MEDCIFCKLANGVFKTNKVYEDELFTAFLDADPATKGHTLIVPKKHYKNLFELGQEERTKLLDVASIIADRQVKALGAEGVNLAQNNGEVAGQTVMHFHLHVIPRYSNQKDTSICSWSHEKFSEEEFNEIREKLEK